MLDLFSKNIKIEIISVVNELEKLNIEIKDHNYSDLVDLASFYPYVKSAEDHAKIVKDFSLRRKLITSLNTIILNLKDTSIEVNTNLNNINSLVLNSELTYDFNSNVNLKDRSFEIVNEIKNRANLEGIETKGFKTGFESLDKILVGFKKEDFIIIGARPSVGKTTLALNIALNIGVIKKHKVGFFSLEMSSDSLVKRSLSFFSKILHFKIQHEFLRDIEKKELDLSLKYFENAYFLINSKSNLDILSLCSEIRRMVRLNGVEIIFIDYLGLISSNQRNQPRFEQVAFISKTLKDLARTLCIPIVALSQLTRDVQDKEPNLASLREFGALEQDADVVILMHRNKSQQEVSDARDVIDNLDIKVIVSKNRNGSIRDTTLGFCPNTVSFIGSSR